MQTAAVPNLWRRFEGICKLDFSSSEIGISMVSKICYVCQNNISIILDNVEINADKIKKQWNPMRMFTTLPKKKEIFCSILMGRSSNINHSLSFNN